MKNFKELKDGVIKNLFESTVKNEKNIEFKKFLTEVKKSPILKLQMEVYDNLENGKGFYSEVECSHIVESNMRLFNTYTVAEIKTANQNLMEAFGFELGEGDAIFNLVLESAKDAKLGRGLTTNFGQVFQEFKSNCSKMNVIIEGLETAIPMKKVIKRATEILNDKYSFLSENEMNIVKSFLHKDEETKEKLFKELVNENLKLVKRKLFESEDEHLIEKLEQINEKLNTFSYSDKTEIKEFSQLIDLQSTLR